MPVDEKEVQIADLSRFVIKRTLSDSSQRKVICVEGEFTNDDDDEQKSKSVLLLERKALTEEHVKLLCKDKSAAVLKKQFVNDVYGSYDLSTPVAELSEIKATIICPATDDHIKKFERKRKFVIEETPNTYETITLPFIEHNSLNLQWLYNILDHKSEFDRIVYEDPDEINGFILLPDLKWDRKDIESLYLLAITRIRTIKSIRDLTQQHLPLLENIRRVASDKIEEIYGLPASRLRIYLHYHPSFYHLHVHFSHLDFEAPGISCERAHPLSTVINNLTIDSKYYQKSTLTFCVNEEDMATENQKDSLFSLYIKAGLLKTDVSKKE